jgi:hypothetical protein
MTMDLEGLGQHVAATQERRLATLHAAEKAREGFLADLAAHNVPKPRTGLRPAAAWGLAAAAALAGAAATFVALRGGDDAPAFSVGDEPFASAAGRHVVAPATGPVPIHFSDGSELKVEAESSVVVASLDRAGAVAELEHGRTAAKVVHRTNTRWTLHAGPYSIAVVGTRFELDWKPAAQRLVVRLDEGRVLVSGGNLASAVPVEAGQVLVASDGTWRLAPAAMGADVQNPPAPAADSAATSPTSVATAAVAPPPEAPAGAGAAATPEPAPARRWQQLAVAGKYDDALALAEREGFEATCRAASAADLMTLSDVARIGKRPARARQALLTLRERFPGDAQAATAAFLLGRMAGGREAAQWFQLYLREAPSGALRREASGRLLEALSQSGDAAAASEAARAYLKQYPNGPHAPLAERLARP